MDPDATRAQIAESRRDLGEAGGLVRRLEEVTDRLERAADTLHPIVEAIRVEEFAEVADRLERAADTLHPMNRGEEGDDGRCGGQ